MSWPNQKKFEEYLHGMKDSLSEKRITAIADLATREFRYYKYAVLSLERYLKHSHSPSRLGIAYVLDAILKKGKSRYKNKDPFPKRFSKNIETTLKLLLDCDPKDKGKIVKLIKLWSVSRSFSEEAEQIMEDIIQQDSSVDRKPRSSHNAIRDRRKEAPQTSNTGDLLSSLNNLGQEPSQEPAAPVNDSFDDILGSFDYGDEENEDDRIAEQKRRLEQQRKKASNQFSHPDSEALAPNSAEPEAPVPAHLPPVPDRQYEQAPPMENQASYGQGSHGPERAYGEGPPLPDRDYGRGPPERAYGEGPPLPDRDYGRGPPMPNQAYGAGPPIPDRAYGRGPPTPERAYGPAPPVPNRDYGRGPPPPERAYGAGPPVPDRAYGRGPPPPERAYGPAPPVPNRDYGRGAPMPHRGFGQGPPVPERAYGAGPPMPERAYGQGPDRGYSRGPPMRPPLMHPPMGQGANRVFDYGQAPPPMRGAVAGRGPPQAGTGHGYAPPDSHIMTVEEQELVNDRGWIPSPNQTRVPPGMAEVLSTIVYVGGIAPDQTSSDLHAKFESYGQIVDIRVLKNSAFIKFKSRSDAENAKELIGSYNSDLKIGWGKGSHLDAENFDNKTGIGLVPLQLVSKLRLPPPPPMRPRVPMQGPPHPPAGYGGPPAPPGRPAPLMSPRRPPGRFPLQSTRAGPSHPPSRAAGPPPGVHPDRWNENFRSLRENEASHKPQASRVSSEPAGPPPHMNPDRWRMSSGSRPMSQGRDNDRELERGGPPPSAPAPAPAPAGEVDARPPPVSMASSGSAGPPPNMHPDRWRQKMAAQAQPPPSDGGDRIRDRQRPRKRSRWDT